MKIKFNKNLTLPIYGTARQYRTYAKGQVVDVEPDTEERHASLLKMAQVGSISLVAEGGKKRLGRPPKEQIVATSNRNVGRIPPV